MCIPLEGGGGGASTRTMFENNISLGYHHVVSGKTKHTS